MCCLKRYYNYYLKNKKIKEEKSMIEIQKKRIKILPLYKKIYNNWEKKYQ
jgi:hypothetical protein